MSYLVAKSTCSYRLTRIFFAFFANCWVANLKSISLKTTQDQSFSLGSFYKSSYFEIKNLADFLEMNLNYFLGISKEAFKITSIRILSHDAFWKMFLKLPWSKKECSECLKMFFLWNKAKFWNPFISNISF